MNAPDGSKSIRATPLEAGRLAFLQHFAPEDIQTLCRDDLLVAQALLGHGNKWGHWQTPDELSMGMLKKGLRDIDLASRLRCYLAKENVVNVTDAMMKEGVVVLTRIALLIRLVSTGGSTSTKNRALKPHSVAQILYQQLPRLTARAICRKATSDAVTTDLFRYLTDVDLHEFSAIQKLQIELERLDTLAARGNWSDVPLLPEVRRTTNPAQKPMKLPLQRTPEPHLPLPDDWLEEIGPRVLWVVQELGPYLLELLEALPEPMKSFDWTLSKTAISRRIREQISKHLHTHPWLDRAGSSLTPPFAMTTGYGKHGADKLEWPPRNYEHVVTLCLTLQSAHLFITLLTCAGRIGEVAKLNRDCVSIERDSKNYLNGKTYKLAHNFLGDERQWPAPPVLRTCMAQQARLASVLGRLPRALNGSGVPEFDRYGDKLWVSFGSGGNVGNDTDLVFNHALQYLAKRLSMSHQPGGKLVHAHRFRKTIGRLAGVALFNSPLVLKRLFGHKKIEMTLHYILSDPSIREEAEKVLRELRIMHCAEALEEIHDAIDNHLPLPGNGGAGAARLVVAVQNQQTQLEQKGRVWGDGSAYDLACLLTGQGKGWRLINPNIVCSKEWVCSKPHRHKELVVNKPKCDPGCTNRVVLARRHRDTEENIEWYLDTARKGRNEGNLLTMAHAMELLREELGCFSDLREKYLSMPEVQALFALCEDTGEPAICEFVEALV